MGISLIIVITSAPLSKRTDKFDYMSPIKTDFTHSGEKFSDVIVY
ncbi:Uncharacterised protein [Providencia rustigianii]|nr:Uncharacterised protein [Providencia rustigianii]VEB69548.1 Uncharacterised protein [Providencia rustigianii]